MISSEEIKAFAKKCGADIVGIGSMDRFDGAPRQYDPRYIMPEAKSIIGLGFRIHRGLLRGIEEGTFFAAYPSMGYANINDVYAPIVLREVGNLLEDNGYEAFLFQNTSVRLGSGIGKPVSPDKPKPDVFMHFRIAAVICGMGELGYSNLFLSPEFGPRQRLAFIITDAELEPDPIYNGPPLCDYCMSCVRECPAGAISEKNQISVTISGKTFVIGKLDELKCSAVYQAGTSEYSPFISEEVASVINSIVSQGDNEEKLVSYEGNIWNYLRENVPYIKRCWESYHHPAAICGARGCIRACMIHLEESRKIKNIFKSPFRRREPWRL
ncbi:(4Fe-4S)-binding protein [bacterium]|nr:(4Fe-4S)-binding protein [bacterium]